MQSNTKVICIQPTGAPAMTLSWRAKQVIQTETIDTIADGVAGRHPIPEVLQDLLEVADVAYLVQEASIIEGMRLLYRHAGLVTEPSAALGIAAVLENKPAFQGQRIASIICGSNVSLDDFENWGCLGSDPRPESLGQ
ncbi:MAG: pyridoxal-phosphate dependent enzyme [Rubripirellula sp.]